LSFAGLHEVESLVVRNCSLRGKCGAPRTSYQRIGRCHATLWLMLLVIYNGATPSESLAKHQYSRERGIDTLDWVSRAWR
jgi:hypothetical protein